MSGPAKKYSAFGARLTQLMEAAGLTQGELARRTGIKQQSISGWVRGINVPSIDRAAKIAKVLKVSVDSLITPDLTSDTPEAEGEAEKE